MITILQIDNTYTPTPESLHHYPLASRESLFAKAFIAKTTGHRVQSDARSRPIYGDFCWSISHKPNLVMVGVDSQPIGVDLELLTPRGEELFSTHSTQEYSLVGGVSWEMFFRLWTAKESALKLFMSGLDELSLVHIETAYPCRMEEDGVHFDWRFMGRFRDTDFVVDSGCKYPWVYAVAKERKIGQNEEKE